MIGGLARRLFGSANDRYIRSLGATVEEINALEPEVQNLSDEQLAARTVAFKERLAQGETIDDILPEAFATVREAAKRTLGQRHFDVQLVGGLVLHKGQIAEMKTGEGKTLVATLAVYLNALAGHGVHVVTVNDYLAKRDAEWMGKIYEFLGMTVGVIVHDLDDGQRRKAYASDITYGTNNEFGFDYLRDNMKFELADCVQRGHYFSIVDEVDSILIDEARTPLIISGPTDQTTDKYARVNRIIPSLEEGEEIEKSPEEKYLTGDFVVDEKHKTISVTDEGWEKIEKVLGIGNIADPENWDLKHHVETAIKAHSLYKRDVQYVVKDGEVIIVDEFTGRMMPGRRWSDGLHQAVEAKEGVNIRREDQTLATITFQNYFRLYKKLAGMTGTAETEASEFGEIYKLDIVVIPTNRPMLRQENPDVVFRTSKEKYFAVAEEIAKLHENQQPVLVGTTSIEKSELLSQILARKGVRHVVLNAKYHEREAEIVAQAGRLGMVTIATNMAGRGTDILLGGNPEFVARQELVKKGLARAISAAEGAINPSAGPGMLRFYYQGQEFETALESWEQAYQGHAANAGQDHDAVVGAGGLHILGTERHESRRIDNQLRGRAGRQGDPGASRFYLSLEDDLMRIFARDWVARLLHNSMEENVPIESRMVSNQIEKAQKSVEGQNFEARKHLLEYDDVMNKQREAVYGLRHQLLKGLDQKELIVEDYVPNLMSEMLDACAGEKVHPDQWDLKGLNGKMAGQFGFDLTADGVDTSQMTRHELGETIFERLKAKYEAKEQLIGDQAMRFHERMIMLSVLDGLWKDHLLNMDHLKEGIGLRGYGQQDPLVAYKKESFEMFEGMMERFQEDTVRFLFLMKIVGPDGQPVEIPSRPRPAIPAAPPVASADGAAAGNGHRQPALPPVSIPTRAPSTTIDDLEREFERKKKRELEHARMAGAGDASAPAQRRTGEKVGRNDPCPCGSGKKYKKCHGAGEA
ncbi:MAG TPA: preprotein translocase subunit SecA [Acidobacteriaceae bacterium]|nr:preprotein translocase subunit SecA [Acidobacteriaceae bacterium]